MKVQVMTINSIQESSKSELSSGTGHSFLIDFISNSFASHLICNSDVGAASAAASAVCTYYVIIGGRFAPPYKYMVKYVQQKQQQKQQQHLSCKLDDLQMN